MKASTLSLLAISPGSTRCRICRWTGRADQGEPHTQPVEQAEHLAFRQGRRLGVIRGVGQGGQEPTSRLGRERVQ